MNLGAHIAVVDRSFPPAGPVWSDDEAGRLLGAALPDLATIGRFRLLGTTDHGPTSQGIALHHRTDDLFHRHPWFTQRNKELTAALGDVGVARGPAMACSHVGIELLLDGRLTAESEILSANDAAFSVIASLHHRLLPLVPAAREIEWGVFLDRLATRPGPPDYRDPGAVAVRLHQILAARPRLALPDDQIGLVADALAARQASIADTALDLVADIASRLTDDVSTAPSASRDS